MTLSKERLEEITHYLAETELLAIDLSALKARFPHVGWTRCDASDVDEDPFQTVGRFELHLMDGRDHCIKITDRTAEATGIILAERRR